MHESIATEFMDRIVKWSKNIKISDPLEEGCRLGPVVSKGQYEKILKFISTAKDEGATILSGGARPNHLKKGFFVEPTIITDVNTSMQFGEKKFLDRFYVSKHSAPRMKPLNWQMTPIMG